MEYRISTNILSICIIWLQIRNLHTQITLEFSFLSICTISSWVAQVAETHIDTWIWYKVHSNNFLSLLEKKFSI